MRTILYGATALAILLTGCAATEAVNANANGSAEIVTEQRAEMLELFEYMKAQKTTGFVIIRNGETLVEQNWPQSKRGGFRLFVHGKTDDGMLLEDVASQQKSFIAVLVGIAVDKGLIDVDKPVSDYLRVGWSNAAPEQEAQILVEHVLMMNTGLDEEFNFAAPVGTQFFYNTPVFSISKSILTEASGLTLKQLTRDWLTEPTGMADTSWRQRPAVLANVGNSTGLVTTSGDTARFGQLVLRGGVAENGSRVISEESMKSMFDPSVTNPAYGRLWWLNSGNHVVMPRGKRREGKLISRAPADLVAALGYLDRKLYVVPSLDLVVVRTGADAPDKDFDEQIWERLNRVLEID